MTFVVSVRFIIPLIFLTGCLALFSRQVRKDVRWCVQLMKVGTQKAALAAAAEHLAVEVSMREENLYEAFRVITTTNGKNTVSLAETTELIYATTDKRNFIPKLAELLHVEAGDIEMDYRTFRGFMSLLAQRTIFAKAQGRAARAYRDVDDACRLREGGATMDAANLQLVAKKIGFENLSHKQQEEFETASSTTGRSRSVGFRVQRRRAAARFSYQGGGGAPGVTENDSSEGDFEEAGIGNDESGSSMRSSSSSDEYSSDHLFDDEGGRGGGRCQPYCRGGRAPRRKWHR